MPDKPTRSWAVSDADELYNLSRWGRRFFSITPDGNLSVRSNQGSPQCLPVKEVVEHFSEQGVAPPMIIRFPGIIEQRTEQINAAFQSAITRYGFNGKYRLFYPVKVNQHLEVIKAAVAAGEKFEGGLEAGSKAELLAVIGIAKKGTRILCNGFKDKAVVEAALRAKKLGHDVTIVIEKPNELELILKHAKRLDVRPQLGVRVKLSSKGGGHWSGSGGVKSKFGLSIPELTVALHRLGLEGYMDCVSLLHFHPGSQISNVRTIKSALIEVARIYVDLIEYGAPIKTIDVGGGLAVDYTGNRNKDQSSMNYTLREYANDVVYQIQAVCDVTGTPHPDIYSESGRALVAHHSLLVVPVIGTSQTHLDLNATSQSTDNADNAQLIDLENSVEPKNFPPLHDLKEIHEELNGNNLLESFHDAQSLIDMVLQMFSNGMLDIWHRSYAERMGWAICMKISSLLDELEFVPRELKQLRNLLADTYFVNFSLFQALPDAWAINQLFPIMPIHRLDERPSRFGVLGDITCDSDGKIDCFIGELGDRASLPLHAPNDDPYYVAILLIGAYQEALSDDHNLMGKYHIATIHDPDDRSTWELVKGSSLDDVLEHVHHDSDQIQIRLAKLIQDAESDGLIATEEAKSSKQFFEEMASGYTYLTDDDE
jgi:arginine decarboxylase